MKKNITTRGVIPIIAIIAGLVALGGAGAVLTYMMNNETTLQSAADEMRAERAAQAQEGGYPSVWVEDGMPEYPGGTLTKTSDSREYGWGAQVTFETEDSLIDVKAFFDAEMTSRGFTNIFAAYPVTEFAVMARYKKGEATLSLQAAKLKEGSTKKVILSYGVQNQI